MIKIDFVCILEISMQEYKIEEIILTYIRVSLGASIKFCNFRNIKSINKCSPYLWSQP